jgi:hypothetical protein
MGRSSPLLLAFTAIVALLCLPAGASAGTRSTTVTLPAGTGFSGVPHTVTVKCPKHQRATGGGFRTLPFDVGIVGVNVSESRKIGQRRWQVTASQSETTPVPLTAYAYCSRSSPRTKARSTTIPGVDASTISTADADCGRAGKAQAGGFFTTEIFSPNLGETVHGVILDSFRSGAKTWRTRFRSYNGASLTSYIYCADAGAPQARTGSVSASGSYPTATASSQPCKRRPLAGGFSAPDSVVGSGYYSGVTESFRNGKSWRVSHTHVGAPANTLISIAYCA